MANAGYDPAGRDPLLAALWQGHRPRDIQRRPPIIAGQTGWSTCCARKSPQDQLVTPKEGMSPATFAENCCYCPHIAMQK
jgi:hypothetical protein